MEFFKTDFLQMLSHWNFQLCYVYVGKSLAAALQLPAMNRLGLYR
jgi:hypothetical protein